MTLVQIDLRRGPARATPAAPGVDDATTSAVPHDAAEGDHARDGHHRETADGPVLSDSLGRATAGLVLAGGLTLLAPLAAAASLSAPALILLLVGLLTLGMFAVLLRPALAETEPP